MKIFVFGDSFSTKFSDGSFIPTGKEYIKWKGYEPKIYPELLSEHFDANLINKSFGGTDNETIFFKFIDEFSNIGKDDLVIFGWSNVTRFSFVERGMWISSTCRPDVNFVKEMLVNRDHKLYKDRQFQLIEFLDKVLPSQKVIHWKWSHIVTHSIGEETNMEVKDNHYNEYGHQMVAKKMIEGLQINDKVRIDVDNLRH